MSNEELSEAQNQLLATYAGTNIETISRELTAIDNPDVDPDFRPQVLNGLPWWTMKIPQALKYRPLFEKAWEEGKRAGLRQSDWEHGDTATQYVAANPYKETGE